MKYRLLLLPCALFAFNVHAQTASTVAGSSGTPNTVAPGGAAFSTGVPSTVAQPLNNAPTVLNNAPTTLNNAPTTFNNAPTSLNNAPNTSGVPGAGSLFPAATANPPVATPPNINPALANPGGLPSVQSVTNLNGVTNGLGGLGTLTNNVAGLTNIFGGSGGLFTTTNGGFVAFSNGAPFTITNGVVIGTNGIIMNQNAGAGLGTVPNAGFNGSASTPQVQPSAPFVRPEVVQPNPTPNVARPLGTPPLR
ncbi:MAG: hypothetical protein JWM04_2113 [Verrucomicrobiales bacterium]|jgi:hypothetical protein|nr:hypothetical protein [Verrucomicrobiales bacterium]